MFDYFDSVKVKYVHYYKSYFLIWLGVCFAISVVFGLYTSCNFQSPVLSKYGCQKFKLIQGQYYSIRPDLSTIYMSESFDWTADEYDGNVEFVTIYDKIIYSKVGDQEQFQIDIHVNSTAGSEVFRFAPTGYFQVPTSVRNFLNNFESNFTDTAFSALFQFSPEGDKSRVYYLAENKNSTWRVPQDILSTFRTELSAILSPVKLAQTYTCNNCMLPGSRFDFQVLIKFIVTTGSTTATSYTILVIIMQLVSQHKDRKYEKLNSDENEMTIKK